jgi:hypothetical protein
MIERFAVRSSQLGRAAIVAGIISGTALAQVANPGANPPAAPTTVTPAYTPLTGSERLHMYGRSLFGPMALFTGAVSAGWGQLNNRPHEWGGGGEAYGWRYGSGYAQRVVRETLIFGSSSLLHQDNRYFRSTDTGVGKRLEHALLSTFTARRDDGSTTFSYSRIGGMFGSSLISRTWQPPSTGSVNSAMENFGTSIGIAAGLNVAREFLPKKFRLIH